jgi:hypothetical protein
MMIECEWEDLTNDRGEIIEGKECEADSLLWEILLDALMDCAPDGMYFGTCEGDNTNFGWWCHLSDFSLEV